MQVITAPQHRHRAWRRLAAALSLTLAGTALTAVSAPHRAHAATLTISRASYADKTLAAILGQVGGVVTGYEFRSPNPYPDDSCFRPTYGPYSGDAPAACWTPNNYPGYGEDGDRLISAYRTGRA